MKTVYTILFLPAYLPFLLLMAISMLFTGSVRNVPGHKFMKAFADRCH